MKSAEARSEMRGGSLGELRNALPQDTVGGSKPVNVCAVTGKLYRTEIHSGL